ncbi:uncharacterized protein JCM6883_001597 [Sporobolomyces salmoneus]|uniref:uncharacterized protein n=1 Tax=Sporobolomyces salmoneus TaxID=183962 RepID=UPI00316FED40
MDGSRRARRQSPYARPAPTPPPQATPSRLRSVLSYLSPFRSSSKPAPTEEQQDETEEEEEATNEGEETDSAEEAAQFALHGRQVARESSAGIFGQQPPASPTPNQYLSGLVSRSKFTSSLSMPDLASIASPHLARGGPTGGSEYNTSEYGGGGAANEELARFFREKAERGEEGLTAIEHAGVMHLMQQAQSIPTAFTPNFASSSTSFPLSTASPAAPASQVASEPTYRRRRTLYVGAGYSSRRRKPTLSSGGITKSSSEGSLFGIASGGQSSGSITDGKRRRTEEDNMEEDIPVASLDDVLVSAPTPSTSAAASSYSPSAASTSTEKVQDKPKSNSKPPLSRFASTSTPAKPSPLWQVSQANTPSPSPPRKPPTKGTTGAANLMLDVIQQVDAANPAPKPQVAPGKEAILNPYDNDANPLALASKRVPRSSGAGRAKSSTPRASARSKAAQIEKPKEKEKEKEISPLEQLERTMPAEYRRDQSSKRSKPSTSTSSTKSTPKPKKAVEVVELLSSDAEGDAEQDADEEMSPAPTDSFPTTKKEEETKSATPFGFAPSSTKPVASASPANGFSFASTSKTTPSFSLDFGASSSTNPPQSTPSRKTPSLSPSALTPPPVQRPSSPKASLPPTPPPSSAPFTFSLAPPSFVSAPTASTSIPAPSSSDVSSVSPRDQIASLPRSSLPVHEFDFNSIFTSSLHSDKNEDASVKAVKDLVRNMGKGELPSFVF